MDQILELQMIESDSIVSNPVSPGETSPAEMRPFGTSPIKSEVTYHTTDYSDGIQVVITKKSRKRVPIEHFNNNPEASLSVTCPNVTITEQNNTSLI